MWGQIWIEVKSFSTVKSTQGETALYNSLLKILSTLLKRQTLIHFVHLYPVRRKGISIDHKVKDQGSNYFEHREILFIHLTLNIGTSKGVEEPYWFNGHEVKGFGSNWFGQDDCLLNNLSSFWSVALQEKWGWHIIEFQCHAHIWRCTSFGLINPISTTFCGNIQYHNILQNFLLYENTLVFSNMIVNA